MLPIEDERQIRTVVDRYATGIDSRDYRLFRTCFADAIDCDYGAGNVWTSGDAITEYMDHHHRDMGATLHRNTNIVVDGAGDAATGRTYVDALLMDKDGVTVIIHAAGYYDDGFARIDGAWKIVKRRFTLVRMTGTWTPPAH